MDNFTIVYLIIAPPVMIGLFVMLWREAKKQSANGGRPQEDVL